MHRVIHWSYSFPAQFPDRLAMMINKETDNVKHYCLTLKDAALYAESFNQNDVHVVHSALNIPSFAHVFEKTNYILFIHGQHDTSNLKKVHSIIRKSKNITSILVTTPDLLHTFPGSNLFPFAPLDTLEARSDLIKFGSNTEIKSFSAWKGRTVDTAIITTSNYEFKLRQQIYGSIRRFLFRYGKMYSLAYISKSIPKRMHVSSRIAYLNALNTSKVVIDTDEYDFPNGGNISMTGLDALALGVPIYSGISKKNLEILINFYERFPTSLIYSTNKIKLSENKATNLIDVRNSEEPAFDKDAILSKWKTLCPDFFGT